MLEKIEAKGEYLNSDGALSKVLYKTKSSLLVRIIDENSSLLNKEYHCTVKHALLNWSPIPEKKEIPTVKVRAWKHNFDGEIAFYEPEKPVGNWSPINVEMVNHE